LECELGESLIEGGEQQDAWRILFGRVYTIHSNWSKGRGYMHICRGHTGTVTCLALPGAKKLSQQSEGDDSSASPPKHFSDLLFSGRATDIDDLS
jgi:hypothetical protein